MLAYDMNVMFCGRAREGRNRGSCGERGDPGPPPSGPGGVASAPGEHDGGGGREVVAGPVLVDPRHGHAVAPWHGGRVPLLLLLRCDAASATLRCDAARMSSRRSSSASAEKEERRDEAKLSERKPMGGAAKDG